MKLVFPLCLSVVWLASAVLSARPACAQTTADRFAFEWQRSDNAQACAAAESLERMLEQTTGSNLYAPAAANIYLSGAVHREVDPPRWVAHVRILSSSGAMLGERQLVDSSPLCASLTPAVLLVLAMVVAPNQIVGALPPSVRAEIAEQARAEAAMPSVPPPASTASVEPAQSPQVSGRLQLVPQNFILVPTAPDRRGPLLAMALSLGTEFTPSTSVGLSLAFDLPVIDRWHLMASATYWEKATVPIRGPHSLGGGVRFEAGLAHFAFGRLIAVGSALHVIPGMGVGLVYRATQAEALAHRLDRARLYLGPSATLSIDYAFAKHWYLVSHLGTAMLLPRHRFSYNEFEGGTKVLFRPGLFAGWVSLGMAKEL